MCPVSATAAWIMAGVAAAGAVASNVEANRARGRQEEAIREQAAIAAEERRDVASVELNERARLARRSRASARAAAAESGISLDSGSFLAQLQTFDQQFDMDSGLVHKGTHNALRGQTAQTNSALSQIQYKTGLGIALDAGVAGSQAYFAAGGNPYLGDQAGPG